MNNNIITYCSFNIEDFSSIKNLYDNEMLFNKFRNLDLLLIQEWKNKNNEGEMFISKLNENNKRKYEYKYVDRVCLIYDINNFECTNYFPIELAFEAPKMIEKAYTKGRVKSNILTILKPKSSEISNLVLCIINFHLSAYKPDLHKGFHKKQLSKLLKDSLKIIQSKGYKKYGVIIGGDTNYRTIGMNSNNLIEELLDNIRIPNNGILRDVCETKCLNTKTQSFNCIHETGVSKKLVKIMANNKFSVENDNIAYPINSLQDNRLDFIATNLKTKFDMTEIKKLCSVSDHSAIFAESLYEIDEDNTDDDYTFRNALVSRDTTAQDTTLIRGGYKKNKKYKGTKRRKRTKNKKRPLTKRIRRG